MPDSTSNIAPAYVPPVNTEVASFESEVLSSSAPPPSESNPTPPPNTQVSKPANTTPPNANVSHSENKAVAQLEKGDNTTAIKSLAKLEDFDKILNEGNPDVPRKVVVKTEPAKVEPAPNAEESKQTTTKHERNYEGFTEAEKNYLSRMSNEAYDWTVRNITESRAKMTEFENKAKNYEAKIKELSAGRVSLPESYYENPKAAYLAPEISTLQTNVLLANQVQQHWQEQLENIENGKPWNELVNDPKTGELMIVNQPEEPTTAAKIRVQKYFNESGRQVERVSGELNNFVSGFKAKHENFVQGIRSWEKNNLPVFEDKADPAYPLYESIKTKLTTEFKVDTNNPLLPTVAKMSALLTIARDHIIEQQRQQSEAATKAQEVRRAGPNSSVTTGGVVSTVANKPTLDDYERLLR